jgi:ABC-type multidrug transport system permease subunit
MGYVGNRIVEAVTQVVGSIMPLALLTLDQRFLQTGALDLPAFQALGGSLIAVRDQTLAVLGIFFCLGALLFYTMLYQSRLIPRWISGWGFVAALLIGVSTLLGFFDISAGMLLALPIILNEILLGIWLIVRGFEPSAVASGQGK